MKKYILIKLFVFLLPITFWGQNDLISESTKDTENFVSKLRTSKIDTILVYKEYCTGCEITSITKGPMYEEGFINTYIIWLNNGKAFAKKFSYPNIDEKENQINISDVFNFFYEHKKQLGISVGPCHPFRLKWCHFERYYNNTKSLFSLKICFSHRLTC